MPIELLRSILLREEYPLEKAKISLLIVEEKFIEVRYSIISDRVMVFGVDYFRIVYFIMSNKN